MDSLFNIDFFSFRFHRLAVILSLTKKEKEGEIEIEKMKRKAARDKEVEKYR